MATDNEGRQLPPNTYYDSRGYYKYLKSDGKKKKLEFKGRAATFGEAVAMATKLNNLRVNVAANCDLHVQLKKYVEYREGEDRELSGRRAWTQYKQYLTKFVDQFGVHKPEELTPAVLRPWWENMTYDMQHNRRSAFSRFFQFMISEGVTPHNPFTKADNAPKLFEKPKPQKKRGPLLPNGERFITTPRHQSTLS